MMNKRLNYIDALKGLGIICVIIGHIMFEYMFPLNVKYYYVFNHFIYLKYNVLFNFIYSFHMPLFFIISGFLIHDKFKKEIPKENISTSYKLLVSYFIYSIISITLNLVTDYFLGEKYFENFVKNIFITIIFDGFSALWFLPSFFIAKKIFFLLKKSFNQKQELILYTLLIIITFIFSLNYDFYFWINNNINLTTALVLIANIINRSLIGTLFISIGYYSYIFIEKIHKNKKTILVSLLLLVINILLSNFNEDVDLHYSVINNPILYYYLATSTSLSLIVLFKFLYNKFFTPLEFFGKNSLIILCTHYPMQIIRILAYYVNTNNKLFNGITVFIITIIIEIFLIYIINKIKRKPYSTKNTAD